MQRAHKIRLNPTPEQEQYFRQAAGNARFAWNWALGMVREARKNQTTLPLVGDLQTAFNRIKREQFPFMLETTRCAPEQAFADLHQALTNYFNDSKKRTHGKRRNDGKRVGFPHFTSCKRWGAAGSGLAGLSLRCTGMGCGGAGGCWCAAKMLQCRPALL